MRIVADLQLCQGHGMCEDTAPEIFRVVDSDDGTYAQVEILIAEPDAGLQEIAREAVGHCPNRALSIV